MVLSQVPPMRGAHEFNIRWAVATRIIPAYAGSTPHIRQREPHSQDHPRVYGEHCFMPIPNKGHFGSSPRMRGARFRAQKVSLWHGIIPAYAGSTLAGGFSLYQIKDHPRVCGEHFRQVHTPCRVRGSSPRMRGARLLPGQGRRLLGIIPAYAGSTHPRVLCRSWAWDHPRVCGEHATCTVCQV